MRPRGLPSTIVFLSCEGPPACATLPTAATSAESASSAVVHGLVAGVVPPPVLPPEEPLLLPPPPQAATTAEMAAEITSARVRVINRKPRESAGDPRGPCYYSAFPRIADALCPRSSVSLPAAGCAGS